MQKDIFIESSESINKYSESPPNIQKFRSSLTKKQHKQQFMLLWTNDWIMLMHYGMGYQNV